MKLINPFKKQQKQNKFIEVKYSKLDHIGKVKRYEIPDKSEIDNQLNSVMTELSELKKNIEKISNMKNPLVEKKELKVNNIGNLINFTEFTLNNKRYAFFSFKKNDDYGISTPSINIPIPSNHTQGQITFVYCYLKNLKIYSDWQQTNLQRVFSLQNRYVGFVNWYPTVGNDWFNLTLPYKDTIGWIFELQPTDNINPDNYFEYATVEVELHNIPYIYNK